MDVLAALAGIFLLVLALWDMFQTIVVPRPSPGSFRISRYLVRSSWWVLRAARNGRSGRPHDALLGLFAPAATIALLAAWLLSLIVGYGLIMWALRDELQPVPGDLGTAVYFAATSLLTIGFGDFVATGTPARIVIVIAAVTGLGVVALVVTFLFSLYASYQRREVQVVTLQAAAGAPSSAVALLESYARLGVVERLPSLFVRWESWAAEVLDSHVAYPLLGYFRSSHDNLSWISALGTMLDTASLVLTTVVRGAARRREAVQAGRNAPGRGHLQPRLPGRVGRNPGAGRLDAACDRLEEVGYTLEERDVAWPMFEAARATYADRLEAMAAYWAVPATSWLGDPVALRTPIHPMEE